MLTYVLLLLSVIILAVWIPYFKAYNQRMKYNQHMNKVVEGFKDQSEMKTDWQCYPINVGDQVKYTLGRKDLQGQVQCATTAPASRYTRFDQRTCPKCPACQTCPQKELKVTMPTSAPKGYEPDIVPTSLLPQPTPPPTEEEKLAVIERAQDKKELASLTKEAEAAKNASVEADAEAADAAEAIKKEKEKELEKENVGTEPFVNMTQDNCIIYNSMTECVMSKNNMHVIQPYTCTTGDALDPQKSCTQLAPQIWQCVQDQKTKQYAPVRKNARGDVECLGHTSHSCAWTNNSVDCTSQIRNIPNTNVMTCGEKYKDYFGADAYLDADHWCTQFKGIL